MNDLTAYERTKYRRCWDSSIYRRSSPAENHLELVNEVALRVDGIGPGARIIDYGAGTGRAALALARDGYQVHMVDLASNCLDLEVRAAVHAGELTFEEACLWEGGPWPGDLGLCCDVLEHIPQTKVHEVLARIIEGTPHALLQIDLFRDSMGPRLVGEPLHLTVKPAAWWSAAVGEHAEITMCQSDGDKVWILT